MNIDNKNENNKTQEVSAGLDIKQFQGYGTGKTGKLEDRASPMEYELEFGSVLDDHSRQSELDLIPPKQVLMNCFSLLSLG